MRELDERWYGYGTGVVVEADSTGVRTVHEFTSRPGTHGEGDPILLKSASLIGDRLYGCSQTELLVFSHPDLELLHHVTHPVLNDVHHVIPGPGTTDGRPTLLAAVSGQDAVAELTLDGDLVSLWGVDGQDAMGRLDPERDYRINCDLKPHAHHPNHLFRMPDGSVWVTRFETRDAVQVGDVARRIDVGRERCHDGVVADGLVHFTTVDGYVVAADVDTLEIAFERRLAGSTEDRVLGWCRGLTFFGDVVAVGFSRIRHTKVRGALSWVRKGFTQSEPTRIAVYDRRTWALLDEIDLEPAGCNAVFSIVDGGAER